LEENRIVGHVERYKFLLESLVDGNINYKKAKKVAKLNHYLDEIMNKD
jgi:hypothetical protein